MKASQKVWLAVDDLMKATGLSEAEVRRAVVQLLAAKMLERGADHRGLEAFRLTRMTRSLDEMLMPVETKRGTRFPETTWGRPNLGERL